MKIIKNILAGFGLLILVSCLMIGCQTPPDRIAYNTIGSVEDTATAAYDGYVGLVINHTLPTNDLPRASQTFNQVQGGVTLAATTAKNGTNALSPAYLTAELNDLLALLKTISNTNH